LDGEPLAFDDTGDRRAYMAEWLTSPENPYFSRAIVNRVWANFLGVGIVEAVDDVRLTNPPSNEALLAALSNYLVEQRFDLKALMRLVLTSETYQRSSEPLEGNRPDERYYSRYYPKRLSAEVLLDAISQVAEAPTKFANYPDGTRAMQLRDASVDSYFLQTFGRPDRLITCECERTSDPSMTQVLHILNGDTLNEKLSRTADEKAKTTDNRIGRLLKANTETGAILDEIYLAAFARLPSEEDRAQLLEVLASVSEAEKRASLEDLAWSLLSSKEFLFNH
jgi:hypothetical protein